MAGIKRTRFGGIAPIAFETEVDTMMAQVAEDVDLSRNTLRPHREPKKVSDVTGRVIWREDCCEIVSDNCRASIAHNFIHCGFVFATGLRDYPVYGKKDEACAGDWCRLGLPCDTGEPTATVLTPQDIEWTTDPRLYAYRLINRYGHGGLLSPASNEVDARRGDGVLVAGIPTSGFDEYCITSVEIYRTDSGLDFGLGDKQVNDSGWYKVGEIPFGVATFVDASMDVDVEHTPLEQDFAPPPDGLFDIAYGRESQLFGLTEHGMWFSEKNNYHAWPDKFLLKVHDGHKKLSVGRGVAYILNDGCPAVVDLTYDTEAGALHRVIETQYPHPIVSRSSAVVYGNICYFATRRGLVALSPNGEASVISQAWYTADQWENLEPWTMHANVHDGYYYGFFKNHAIRLRLSDNAFARPDKADLTTLSMRPVASYRSDDNKLYLAFADGTYQWGASDGFMTLKWQSKLDALPSIVRFCAFKLRHRYADFDVYHSVNGRPLSYHHVKNSEIWRIPLGRKGLDWEVRIEGKGEVYEYHIATSVRDVAQS